jgi:polygalacturonase
MSDPQNIMFTGGLCSGGHGLSIGSVGGRSDNIVNGVTFQNSHILKSQNGVRIKTISGDTGMVMGVTYKSITMSGITKYGIVVEQAYDGTTGKPTNGVPITDFTLTSVTGTVSSSATGIFIDCGSGSRSNWHWSGVSIAGGKKSTSCLNVPRGVSC